MSEYDTDVLTWSERQAELLRRVANGEAPNETPDWNNIIEEILDVGGSALRAVESLLYVAIVHRLKLIAWPDASAAVHWATEANAALARASRQFKPSMRQRLKIEDIYDDALAAIPEVNDGVPTAEIPETCPFSLDEFLASVKRRKRS